MPAKVGVWGRGVRHVWVDVLQPLIHGHKGEPEHKVLVPFDWLAPPFHWVGKHNPSPYEPMCWVWRVGVLFTWGREATLPVRLDVSLLGQSATKRRPPSFGGLVSRQPHLLIHGGLGKGNPRAFCGERRIDGFWPGLSNVCLNNETLRPLQGKNKRSLRES